MKYLKILWLLVPAILVSIHLLSRIRKHEADRLQTSAAVSGVVKLGKFTVIIDNNVGGTRLLTRWGLSILVEADNYTVLFDTGPDPDALRLNMQALGINAEKIDAVFISHGHHDHIGGISYIAAVRKDISVYLPAHIGKSVKEELEKVGFKVFEVSGPTEIYPGILSLGEMYCPPYEHSLAICFREGVVIVVGCSHPGIEKIVYRASEITGKPVIMVIGGFHLGRVSQERLESVVEAFRTAGVKAVFPIHCSGDNARKYFKAKLGEAYMDGHVGVKVAVQNGVVKVIEENRVLGSLAYLSGFKVLI